MARALAELAEQPFELLEALEARLAPGGADPASGSSEQWGGLAFSVGNASFVAPRAEVREIVAMPAVTRVPRARPWLLGIANVRGSLLPITHLAGFLGLGHGTPAEGGRVIVLNDDEVPAGFRVDDVGGFRQFTPGEQRHDLVDEAAAEPVEHYLLGAFQRDGEAWRVLSLRKLAADPAFRDAGI